MIPAVVVIALLSAVAGASADRTSYSDPRGDSPDPFYDYLGASAAHRSEGRLHHQVTTLRRISNANAGILELDVDGRGGCEYAVANFTYGRSLIDCDTGKEAGTARVVKVNDHTMSFTFRADTIGRPARYRWRYSNGDDRLPNSGWKLHVLR